MTKTNFEANQDFTERYAQMRGKASLLEVVEVFSRTHHTLLNGYYFYFLPPIYAYF
jgi:hypothetical protein